jgi:GGDEF domain-containing protein
MVHNAIHEIGCAEDFLAHLGPADFVLITGQERAASLQERIRTRLEQSLDYFYPIKDRELSATHSKRLAFNIGILHSSDGLFTSLDVLKSSLLRKKQ